MTTIKLADHNDLECIKVFIDKHWRKGHVLAVAPGLLEWQHGRTDGKLNILIAVSDDEDRAIDGMLGFIPTYRFDESLASKSVGFLSLWKVKAGASAGIGLQLLHRFNQLHPWQATGTIGVTDEARAIYKALRYQTGELSQLYITADGHAPKLGLNIAPTHAHGDRTLTEINGVQLDAALSRSDHLPVKTTTYLKKRYALHPEFRYRFSLIEHDTLTTILVWRVFNVSGKKVIRIIDILGPSAPLAEIGSGLRQLIADERADFLDVMIAGDGELQLQQSGFRRHSPHQDKCILPQYFDPFEQRNASLSYSFKCSDDQSFRLCKGDADQDRPNTISTAGGFEALSGKPGDVS